MFTLVAYPSTGGKPRVKPFSPIGSGRGRESRGGGGPPDREVARKLLSHDSWREESEKKTFIPVPAFPC